MAASEFAKRQLKKHGWVEGSGLGKEENGRSEPIKVSLKMDKAGVGHDPGKEFTDHWWLRVFNEAAQKIGKKKQEECKADGEDEFKQKQNNKSNMYTNFVRSTTLTNGVETKHRQSDSSSDDSTDHDNNTSLPTLNDIHKFCGGATGHKAARFGIKMGGKLARIAKHDKMFEDGLKKEDFSMSKSAIFTNNSFNESMEQPSLSYESPFSRNIPYESDGGKIKKKKHKKQKKDKCSHNKDGIVHCLTQTNVPHEALNDEVSEAISKKNKFKKKHKIKIYNTEIDHIEENVSFSELPQNNEIQQEARSKKKRKRSRVIHKDIECEIDVPEINPSQKKKKTCEELCSELIDNSENSSLKSKKRKKKQKM